jgi:hypothetical protein
MRDHVPTSTDAPEQEAAPAAAPLVAGAPVVRGLTPEGVLALQRAAGNRAVARRVLARKEPEKDGPAPPPKAHLDKWKGAGPFGDDLLKLLSELLSPSEVAGLLDDVGEKVGEAAGDPLGKGSGKAIGVGADWAAKAAQKWIKGPKGEQLLAAIRKELGENPDPYYGDIVQSLASSLLIAAKLYADGKLDPPNLEKELKLGAKATLTAGIDLGKPQERWLQDSKLGLKLQLDPRLTMGMGASFGMEEKGGYKLGGDYSLKWLREDNKTPLLGANLQGAYNWETRKWSFGAGLSSTIVKDHLEAQAKLELSSETGKSSVSAGAGGEAGGFDYRIGAIYGLDEGQITKLTAHLGFTSKDQTFAWLADLAYKVADGKNAYEAKLAVQKVVGRYTLRLDATGLYKEGAVSGDVTGMATYNIGKVVDLGLIGGVGYDKYGLAHGGLAIRPEGMKGWLTGQWNQPIGPNTGGLPGFFSLGVVIPLGSEDKKKK